MPKVRQIQCINPFLLKFLPLGFFGGLALSVLAVIMASASHAKLGDIPVYYTYAHAMASGQWPYAKLLIEYPPFVLPFILAAYPIGLIAGSYAAGFLLLASLAVGLFFTHRLLNGKPGNRLALAALLLLPVLAFTYFELDIFAALMLYFGLWFFTKKKFDQSAVLIAMAAMTKAYPAVCLAGLLWLVPKGRRLRYLCVLLAVAAIMIAPIATLAPNGLIHAYTYQAGRPIELEASGAALGYIEHLLGLTVKVIETHASFALLFPGQILSGAVSSVVLLVSLVSISFATFFSKLKPKPVLLSLLLLAVFVLLFKVGSPQYLVTFLVLLPLAEPEINRYQFSALVGRSIILSVVVWAQFLSKFSVLPIGNLSGTYSWLAALLAVARIALIIDLVIYLTGLNFPRLFRHKKQITLQLCLWMNKALSSMVNQKWR